jgi:hypothetical protein
MYNTEFRIENELHKWENESVGLSLKGFCRVTLYLSTCILNSKRHTLNTSHFFIRDISMHSNRSSVNTSIYDRNVWCKTRTRDSDQTHQFHNVRCDWGIPFEIYSRATRSIAGRFSIIYHTILDDLEHRVVPHKLVRGSVNVGDSP